MFDGETIVRVLAAMCTDLATKELVLSGCIQDVEACDDFVVLEHLNRSILDVASAREYLEDVRARLKVGKEGCAELDKL